MSFDSVISPQEKKKWVPILLEYQILRESYRDEYGKETSHHYFIKVRKKLWFIKYWKTIQHEEAGYGDSYKTTTTFKNKLDAAEFVDNVLRAGRKRECWDTELVRHGNI